MIKKSRFLKLYKLQKRLKTMEAKEKANELIEKHLASIIFNIKQNISVTVLSAAKKSALITVDEVIEDRSLRGQINFTYWKEVKKEINKL